MLTRYKVGLLRKENARVTRNSILKAARKLFARRGYDATTIDEIAEAARVTSGAVYHHFRNKQEIMRAVFEGVERELEERIIASSRLAKTGPEAMRLVIRTFFDACLERDIRSIFVEQAPRVLGWDEWKRIDTRYSIEATLDVFSRLQKENRIGNHDSRVVAILFIAAANEAGMQIALNQNDRTLRRECERILDAFLSGLREGSVLAR